MKIKISICIILFTVLCAAGCKKEETATTLPSISGLSITDPLPFVRQGTVQEFHLDISGLTTSDNTDPETVGVFWTFNSGKKDTLSTDLSKSNPPYYATPDTTGTFTVMANVFAVNGKYYNGAVSASFQVIDPEKALTGLPEQEEELIGGIPNRITETGGVTWMANNLHNTVSGRDYRDCEVVSELFGKYFTWEEAQTACPEGWRLPAAAEFDDLLGSASGDWMVNAQFMRTDMWAYWPQVDITNKFLFNAIPTGYIDLTTAQEVFGYKEYACWWTADEDGDLGVYRYIFVEDPVVKKGKGSKVSLALNVRCVKLAD